MMEHRMTTLITPLQETWIRVNVMRKLKFLLDIRSLEIIYISFKRPLLEYADVVWDKCT